MNCHKLVTNHILRQFLNCKLFICRNRVSTFALQNDKHSYGNIKIAGFNYLQLNFEHHAVVFPHNLFARSYAKGRDIKKSKGKKVVSVDHQQLSEIIDIQAFESHIEKIIDTLKEEFVKNLSLRSTTGAIDSLKVHLDGKEYTLQELAQIVRKNPKTIIINMSMFPQAIPAALKSIQVSGMNLNPQQDGTTLYVPVPTVTREHRENLSKNAKKLFLVCRDNIKNVQAKFAKAVKKQDNLSSDLQYNVQLQLGVIADKYISQAEKLLEVKQSELIGNKN